MALVLTDNRYATKDSDLREINENLNVIGESVGIMNEDLNIIAGNTSLNQQYIRPTEFEISSSITRAANATPYVLNSIINGDGLTTLPVLDFSGLGDVAGRAIQINSVTLVSSNGGVTIKLTPIVHLFKADSITGQDLTDSALFDPSYSETILKRACTFENLTTLVIQGSGCYTLLQSEILRNCTLSSTSTLYIAIIAGATYTPESAEQITVIVKGYLL
jgi:hypothetical protein